MIISINIEDIKPYPKNNKKHSDRQIELVANSIRDFGMNQPIVVDSNNICIVGHARIEACKRLGIKQIPCIKKDDLTDEQIKAYRIADNKLSDLGEYDLENIDSEIADLLDADFNLAEYGLDDLIPVEDVEVVEDEAPEPPVNPVTELGDIWLLGNHRVLCGDSTLESSYIDLMEGKKADMVFTDPPYLLNTEGGCKGEIGKGLRKQGSDIKFISDFNPTDFLSVLPEYFNSKNFNAYVFCNKELLPDYLLWARDSKISFNVLVWKKPNAIPIGDSHRPDIEYLLLFRKNAIWNNGIKGVNYSRCLEYGRELGLHPTIKPIQLITNEMQISSNKGSLVADPFLGSGSTLIACEQLDRICYGIELEPKYCDVIVNRWQNLTSKEAVHEKTGKTYQQIKDAKGL